MLLQASSLHGHNHHHHYVVLHLFSSTRSHSRPLPSISFASPRGGSSSSRSAASCSTTSLEVRSSSSSRRRRYGTVDYERRVIVKWNAIYKRISLMENPEEVGSTASALNQWENEGKRLTKWDLCRVVRELRKYRKFKLALEVYEWMNNREERFRISSSDTAIQLDLIAKVRGIADAENYFLRLPDKLKDRRIYGALLNAYVRARMREKAESLLNEMREIGYAMSALPFNVMMTLYMNIKEYDRVDLTISEMMEKDIQLDLYSYNIWLSSRGSQGSAERMEQGFEQMKLDRTVSPNWTTFSTMATAYVKLQQFEKAEDCLKKVETRILGRDRIPYHYLISLYGSTGNKEEVYRVWNIYKLNFPSIPNLGYHAVISSLVRLGDFEGAKKIYDDWLTVKSNYDPRIGNIIMGWYVREGLLGEAEDFFDHMVEVGGKPNPTTWEILAEGHIQEGIISEALSCLKEAVSADGSKSWRPKLPNLSLLSKHCEEQGDLTSKQVLIELLRENGFLKNKAYASLFGMSNGPFTENKLSLAKDCTKHESDPEEGAAEGAEILFDQLQGST